MAGQTTVLQTAQTTAASTSFGGLTPGNTYAIAVNVSNTGASDWSDAISQMVASEA